MEKIIECVPNFSEGRNLETINKIANAIQSINGVKLLHTDIGYDANRTVITFAGNPNSVIQAAFESIKVAQTHIDMSKHFGAHPRIGATDVCPLVPISNISIKETAQLARELAKRVGEELKIPIYCYEESAFNENKRNLADCRRGEYEGISAKICNAKWYPDYGPSNFNEKSGITIIGARNFLIAYNISLNTKSVSIAKEIAKEIRESGYASNDKHYKGKLKKVKAIGWYMPEYACSQVSTNIIDFNTTGMHIVFETIAMVAKKYNVNVIGSELIGLVPQKALIDAGKFYAKNNAYSDNEIINIATEKLGLNAHHSFNVNNRIIENLLLIRNN